MPKEYPRTARLNSQLQRELDALIREELRDPRVAGVTLTAVEVSPDMRHARILVSVMALDRKPEGAAAALNGAAGKLRQALKQRLAIRHIPELHFHPDHVPEEAARLDRLIREARQADRGHANERGEDEA
jgi:ribosome-binding factor A